VFLKFARVLVEMSVIESKLSVLTETLEQLQTSSVSTDVRASFMRIGDQL